MSTCHRTLELAQGNAVVPMLVIELDALTKREGIALGESGKVTAEGPGSATRPGSGTQIQRFGALLNCLEGCADQHCDAGESTVGFTLLLDPLHWAPSGEMERTHWENSVAMSARWPRLREGGEPVELGTAFQGGAAEPEPLACLARSVSPRAPKNSHFLRGQAAPCLAIELIAPVAPEEAERSGGNLRHRRGSGSAHHHAYDSFSQTRSRTASSLPRRDLG